MPKKLAGRVAVITGGTEGIGLATAKLFVKEGAYVFITRRHQKELDEAVKAIGANVSGVQGDVAQLADPDSENDRHRTFVAIREAAREVAGKKISHGVVRNVEPSRFIRLTFRLSQISC